jgi:hypothetical protein
MRVKKINFLFLAFYTVLLLFISNKMFAFPASLSITKIFETDGIFTQVQIQSFIDGAILGSTKNLGFPIGYSHWIIPQFGIVDSVIIWVLGNLTSVTNYGLLSIIGVSTLLLNLGSMYSLGLKINKNRITAFVFGLAGLTTPFALNSLIHVHVMKIFIIPAVLMLLLQLVKKEQFSRLQILMYMIFIFSASLFWINVLVAILLGLIIVELIDRFIFKSKSGILEIYLRIFLYVLVGFVYQAFLYLYNYSLMGVNDRLPWQSDIFSGKFSDVLVGSPLLNRLIPILDSLSPGTSTEAWSNMLGLPLIFGFIFTVYFILSSISTKSQMPDELLHLTRQLAIVSILFFVLGGLSNLQASFFVLLGTASPMRTWSRLSILIAIIGLVIFYLVFESKINKFYSLWIAALVFLFSISDLFSLERYIDDKNSRADQEHTQSLVFIRENLNPCPVLQLPVDTYLLPQGALDKANRYYWTNMIPYIVLPEFKWTAAIYTDSRGWTNVIEKLPIEIQPQDISLLSRDYCAIYFDKDFSQYQIDRQAGLKGTIGLWPGLRISPELIPDYEDTRFSIYLIESK